MKINLIIDQFLSELKGIKNASPNTILAYKRDLNQFKLFLENKNISDINLITKKHIRLFIVTLNSNGISTSSISRKLTTLRGVFVYAIKNGIIETNPLKNISNPKIKMTVFFDKASLNKKEL